MSRQIRVANFVLALFLLSWASPLTAQQKPQWMPGQVGLNAVAGGSGLADLFLEPIGIGWHLKRADIQVAEGLVVPTGRYTPGATDNVGTGYFGNHLLAGITAYITKNKATSANLFTDWEVHGGRAGTNGTNKTPGQAFTMEWGLGQILPIKKNFSQLLQIGLVGYDQWQVTANGGTVPIGSTNLTIPASTLPTTPYTPSADRAPTSSL